MLGQFGTGMKITKSHPASDYKLRVNLGEGAGA